MHWLVTMRAGLNEPALQRILEKLGCTITEESVPIPLGDQEQVIEVEGPRDLRERATVIPEVTKISPSSEMQYHGS